MSYSFLVFDFGANEDVAQQARHKIEGWRQGFRLDKKLQVKFDRKEAEPQPVAPSEPEAKTKSGANTKSKTKAKADPEKNEKGDSTASESGPASEVRLIVRLGFSDHEKLSLQRWLDRIPTEEPFKSTKSKIVRPGDGEFKQTEEYFDSLGKHSPAWAKE